MWYDRSDVPVARVDFISPAIEAIFRLLERGSYGY
jgi:hypothetical protein